MINKYKEIVTTGLLFYGLVSGFAQIQSTVTFDLNYEGADKSVAPISVTTGNALSLDQKTIPTREGYRFAGWYSSKDCKQSDIWLFGKKGGGFWGAASDSMAVKTDMTLYARWNKPVGISTPEQFDKIREDLYGWYVLENDIDLSSFRQWDPIGNYDSSYEYADAEWWSNAFHGRIDGNGHKITGLKITSATGFVSSIFGALANGEIYNLTVDSPVIDLRGESIYASPLLGYMKNDASGMPRLENCHVTNADIRVGIDNPNNTFSGATALVMAGWGGVVKDCSTTGKIAFEIMNLPSGGELYVGALNGECYCTTENCTADVVIDFTVAQDAALKEVKAFVGGLQSSASNMTDCSGKGIINVQDHPGFSNLCIGGVAGSERFGIIRKCSSGFAINITDKVNAHVGGIVGEFSEQYGMIGAITGIAETIIEDCTSVGSLPISGNGIPAPVMSPFGGAKMKYTVK